jgi:hypothetical protein
MKKSRGNSISTNKTEINPNLYKALLNVFQDKGTYIADLNEQLKKITIFNCLYLFCFIASDGKVGDGVAMGTIFSLIFVFLAGIYITRDEIKNAALWCVMIILFGIGVVVSGGFVGFDVLSVLYKNIYFQDGGLSSTFGNKDYFLIALYLFFLLVLYYTFKMACLIFTILLVRSAAKAEKDEIDAKSI